MNSPKVTISDSEWHEIAESVPLSKRIYPQIHRTISLDELTVTVFPANGVMGMRRHRIRYEQSKIEDADTDSRLLRLTSYPDMVACADRVIPFDEFAVLPDAFLSQWEAATYELNPHWSDIGASEKKVTT